MAAKIVDLAEAVVTELNAESFSQAFTATRHYVPKIDLKDAASLSVLVAPSGFSTSIASRANDDEEYTIDIGVLKRLTVDGNTELDPLMLLVEEIKNHFRRKTIASPAAVCTEITNDPIFDIESLDQKRQFASVLNLKFSAIG